MLAIIIRNGIRYAVLASGIVVTMEDAIELLDQMD